MLDLRNCFTYGQYIRRIAFHAMRVQDELLASYEITSQQARALTLIQRCREAAGACCQKDLETLFGLRGSSITSLIKRLEQHGYIYRAPGQEDGRIKELSLTEKGSRLLETFHTILQETERKMVSDMSERERALFLDLLQRAAKNLD